MQSLIPVKGQRLFIVGQTGSGKSEFAIWLMERLSNTPIIIYNTKGGDEFARLKNWKVVRSLAEVRDAIDDPEIDYIDFHVPPHMVADADALDNLLWTHFNEFGGVDVYIDEVFSFSQNGKAGPGLTALLTQGRSRGFITIMSAQRPSWLSRFILTETQKYYVFRLADKKDRQRMGDVIPELDSVAFGNLPIPPEYHFYFYDNKDIQPKLMAPILLDKPNTPVDDADLIDEAIDAPDSGTNLNWI